MGILMLPIVTMNFSFFILPVLFLILFLNPYFCTYFHVFLHVFECICFNSVLCGITITISELFFSSHCSFFPYFLYLSFLLHLTGMSFLILFFLQNFLLSVMGLPLLRRIGQTFFFLYQPETLYLLLERFNSLAFIIISGMLEFIFPFYYSSFVIVFLNFILFFVSNCL